MKEFTGIFRLGLLRAATISAQTLCFENKGLKASHRISFEIEGDKIVEGYYEVIGYDDSTARQIISAPRRPI